MRVMLRGTVLLCVAFATLTLPLAAVVARDAPAVATPLATDSKATAVAAVEIYDVVPAATRPGVPYTAYVRVVGGNQVTGLITVSNEFGGCQLTANVQFSCALNSPVAGDKTITANYAGDANNPPSSDSVPHR